MTARRISVGRFLVVGDIVTDILAVHSESLTVDSDTPARISVTGGGSAANTAVWLASTGAAVDLLGVVGADVAGDDRLAELTEFQGRLRTDPTHHLGPHRKRDRAGTGAGPHDAV